MGAALTFRGSRKSTVRFIAIALITILWTSSYLVFQSQSHVFSSLISINPAARENVIPNIVHYIWIARNPTTELKLGFEHFLSIYSSHMYSQPEKIYLHTDLEPEIVERAKQSSDTWTRLITNLPFLEVNYVVTPTHTKTGKAIRDIQHRSDFIKAEILDNMGGVYVNLEALPLRDTKPLRESGFSNIFGEEMGGICSVGIMLSKKGSSLFKIMRQEMHRVFDGAPGTHSTVLLTALASRLSSIPNQVLIMGRNAFHSSGLSVYDTRVVFKPHLETDSASVAEYSSSTWASRSEGAAQLWESQKTKPADWIVDYSSSYFIQASDKLRVEGWDGQITLEYVLERRSNYALAAYPAIAHAIKAGFLDGIAPDI